MRISNTRSNAVAAQHRRPDRIPCAIAPFAHPRLLARKGEHSRYRKTVAGILGLQKTGVPGENDVLGMGDHGASFFPLV